MRAAADFVGGVLRVGLGLFSVIFGFFVGPLVFRSYWFSELGSVFSWWVVSLSRWWMT